MLQALYYLFFETVQAIPLKFLTLKALYLVFIVSSPQASEMVALVYRPHLSLFSIRAPSLPPPSSLHKGPNWVTSASGPVFPNPFHLQEVCTILAWLGWAAKFLSNANIFQLLGFWCVHFEGRKKGHQWIGWWKGQDCLPEKRGDKKNTG